MQTGWTILLDQGAIIKGAPQMVMGTGLVKQHSGLKESGQWEVTGADRAEEVGGHGAEGAEGRVRWRQRVDVKDRYGKATQSQPQEQLWSRLVAVLFGCMSCNTTTDVH